MKAQNKELEELVKELMAHAHLEKPSSDFTYKIIKELGCAPQTQASLYRPLISKKAMVSALILILILCISLYLFGDLNFGTFLNFAVNDSISFPKINTDWLKMRYSSIFIYSMLFFAALFWVQIAAILKFHQRSLNY